MVDRESSHPRITKVQAVIRDQRLDAVIERLVLTRIRGLTVSAVKGSGATGKYRAFFRGGAYPVHFLSRWLIEWYGPEDEADAVVRAIVHAAATNVTGDGVVFVQPVDDALRIRTGERGLDAL